MFVKINRHCIDWDKVQYVRCSDFGGGTVIKFKDGELLKCPYTDYNLFMEKLKQENIIKIVELDV